LIGPWAGSWTQLAIYVCTILEAFDLIFDYIVAALSPVAEHTLTVVIAAGEQIAAILKGT
jgi:hypothetical protein